LENDNEHFQNKIREYEALTEDLENQLESALEENITLQTEFETYKQTTGEKLIRKDDEIRDIKNDLINKDKFIQRLQARATNGLLVKNLQKNFMENKTKERRRLTLFPGMPGEDNDLTKFQKNTKEVNFNFDENMERTRSHTITTNNKLNSLKDNKTRNSVFTPGFGSLSRLKNKKEELSKNNKGINTRQKKEVKFLCQKKEKESMKNSSSQKSFFSEKNGKNLSPQIEEISESSSSSEKTEVKETKLKNNWEICKENQIEYVNENINKEEQIELNNKNKMENGVIIEDLQKMLDRIRKRKEKLVNTRKANKERIKNLKQK
jgi:hypothetical protein